MKHTLAVLCTALIFGSCNAQKVISSIPGTPLEKSEMERFIIQQIDSLSIPGLSIAIINNSEIVYHRTFGVQNLHTNTPVDNQSLFDAASMTKTIFAYCVLKSVDLGMLDLDTPLYTYLPNPDIQYDNRYKSITARMVLSHSSGFPNWRRFNEDKKLDIKFTPGTDFNYSGEGYEYLADVLAHLNRIEKDSLEHLVQKHVFRPLGMKNSSTVWNNVVDAHRVDGHIKGEVKEGWGIHKEKPGFYASYSLQTEALDYAKFLTALMKGQGLSEESIRQMLDIQIRSKDNERIWGLGIEILELDNGKLVYKHGGFNNDFSSGYLFSKDTNSGYVFLSNSDSGYQLNAILQKYFMK